MTTSVSLKLLDKLESLVQDWTHVHARGAQLLASLENQCQQRSQTMAYIRLSAASASSATCMPALSASLHSNPPMDLQEPHKTNTAVDPPFLRDFPSALPRLLRKQTEAIEDIMALLLGDILDALQAVTASMQTLAKDALAKAGGPALLGKLVVDPASDVPAVVAAGWIDAVAAGYVRELFVLEDLVQSRLDLRVSGGPDEASGGGSSGGGVGGSGSKDAGTEEGSSSSGGNVGVIRREWDVTHWVDLRLEVDIRERVRLAKRMQAAA
ncbi:hypothetical protein BC831DRAFT_477906 [Entophlyctis helioformis]|nr:hypothetical protein BC831DRAFT_477906 [Entophlyctis helioformis]